MVVNRRADVDDATSGAQKRRQPSTSAVQPSFFSHRYTSPTTISANQNVRQNCSNVAFRNPEIPATVFRQSDNARRHLANATPIKPVHTSATATYMAVVLSIAER